MDVFAFIIQSLELLEDLLTLGSETFVSMAVDLKPVLNEYLTISGNEESENGNYCILFISFLSPE